MFNSFGTNSFKKYSPSFILACILHGLIFIILFTTVFFNSRAPYVVKQGHEKKIVSAVAINQQAVDAEILKLKSVAAEKKRAEDTRVAHLHALAISAKRSRQREDRRLRILKRKQITASRTAREKLAKLQKAQALQQRKNSDAAKKYQAVKLKFAKLQKSQAAMAALQAKQKKSQRQADARNLLQEQLNAEQAQLKSARAHYIQGVVNKYNALILQAIRGNWLIPLRRSEDSKVQIQITLAMNGTVLSAEVVKPSGNSALDQSAVTAIYRASPLPVPSDKTLFNQFKKFTITMTPKLAV